MLNGDATDISTYGSEEGSVLIFSLLCCPRQNVIMADPRSPSGDLCISRVVD